MFVREGESVSRRKRESACVRNKVSVSASERERVHHPLARKDAVQVLGPVARPLSERERERVSE